MNKELLIKKYEMKESDWDRILNEHMTKIKKESESQGIEISDEEVQTRAQNSMSTRLLKDKKSNKEIDNVIFFGYIEPTPFNKFRISKMKKMIETDGKENAYRRAIAEELMDENGNILDSYGNPINKENPTKDDMHLIYGVTNKSEFFVGTVKDDNKKSIAFGVPMEVESIPSRSSKQLFANSYRNIISMDVVDAKPLETEQIIDEMDSMFDKYIQKNITIIKEEKELPENIYKEVALQVSIADIMDSNFGSTILCELTNAERYYIEAKVSNISKQFLTGLINLGRNVKMIMRVGKIDENENKITGNVISIWGDKKDLIKPIIVKEVPGDEFN
jgi:hypothetical protein